jgi:hypothetical protein
MNEPVIPEMVYNNEHFTVKEYDWDVFGGPSAGEQFVDSELYDLKTGNKVKLSDFSGQWVVLETGSSTCSMFTKNIPNMKNIEEEFTDVKFLLIYVREAHPGERLGAHKSFEEKLGAARLVKPRYNEHRQVLVDGIEGDFHRHYGMIPNVLYVIRPDGTIHYRCNWATADDLRAALADRENFHTYENADMNKLKAGRGLYTSIRTMWTGGAVALYDFREMRPGHGAAPQSGRQILPRKGPVQQKTGSVLRRLHRPSGFRCQEKRSRK